jgi:glyoxylase-like metal-dependent hydrolase (beta-lactamase superfamily II)
MTLPSGWSRPHGWLTNDWQHKDLAAVWTPGHTKGHHVFWAATERLLFSGDHVLPHLTPSIGFEPRRSPTALADFLASLRRVRDLDARLILPAHGPAFTDLSARVDELLHHHEERLALIRAEVHTSTVAEIAGRLPWTRKAVRFTDLAPFHQVLAVWETGAHLEYLSAQGRITMDRNAAGALVFS